MTHECMYCHGATNNVAASKLQYEADFKVYDPVCKSCVEADSYDCRGCGYFKLLVSKIHLFYEGVGEIERCVALSSKGPHELKFPPPPNDDDAHTGT